MNTTIARHPDAATLMSFAAGSLPEPLAAVVAAHVSMCVECRREQRDMELIGAALLRATPLPNGQDCAVAIPRRPPEPFASDRSQFGRGGTAHDLPLPIARKYHLTSDSIPWKRLGPGIWHHRLPLSPGVKGDLRLLKLVPDCKLPTHGHRGAELTLVIDGAFADETGEYRRGEIQDIDSQTEHRPAADKTLGCICLVANDRGLRFKGLLGLLPRLLWQAASPTTLQLAEGRSPRPQKPLTAQKESTDPNEEGLGSQFKAERSPGMLPMRITERGW